MLCSSSYARFILAFVLFLPAAIPAKKRVVLISIDGWAYWHWQKNRDRTPNLNAMAEGGAHGKLESIFPSMTWPAHMSMVTGTYPEKHGVTGNRFADSARNGIVKAWELPKDEGVSTPAIYDLAEKHGLSSAALLWPGSGGAKAIKYNLPEVYLDTTLKRFTTDRFRKELMAHDIPLDDFIKHSKTERFELDGLARDAAIHILRKQKPELLLVHFVSLDTAMHRDGPDTPEARWALQIVDMFVGDLYRQTNELGLLPETSFIVASDHGFLKVKNCIDLNLALVRSGLLSSRTPGRIASEFAYSIYNGHAAFIYLKDRQNKYAVARILRILKNLGSLIEKVYAGSDFPGHRLPASGGQMPDLIALARPDTFFGNNNRNIVENADYFQGMHGYLPDHEQMKGSYIIAGPEILEDAKAGSMKLVDIAPTALRLLLAEKDLWKNAIEGMDGRPNERILRPAAH